MWTERLRRASDHLGNLVDRPFPATFAPQHGDAAGQSLEGAGQAQHLVDDVAR